MIRFEQVDRESTLDEPVPVRTVVEMDEGCGFGALMRAFVYFALALGYHPDTIAAELDEETAKELGL